VIATTAAIVALAVAGIIHRDLASALVGGGIPVAVIGFLDDRYTVSAKIRLVVHVGAAVLALVSLGVLPALRTDSSIPHLGWIGSILSVLVLVWILNLFNFMDGIDAIAASEATFIACAGAWLTLITGGPADVPVVSAALAPACVGFLLWNWPPAKIFMGDVGSGYLGFVIGVLIIAAGRENREVLWAWVILGGVFFVDATVTLTRRLLRGERIYEAHRTHAYQWLARRWGSHKRVTLTVLAVNILWLLPCAFLAAKYPDRAVWIAVASLLPLGFTAIVAGSGRREQQA